MFILKNLLGGVTVTTNVEANPIQNLKTLTLYNGYSQYTLLPSDGYTGVARWEIETKTVHQITHILFGVNVSDLSQWDKVENGDALRVDKNKLCITVEDHFTYYTICGYTYPSEDIGLNVHTDLNLHVNRYLYKSYDFNCIDADEFNFPELIVKGDSHSSSTLRSLLFYNMKDFAYLTRDNYVSHWVYYNRNDWWHEKIKIYGDIAYLPPRHFSRFEIKLMKDYYHVPALDV